jgi:glutathione S-transferase
MTDLPILYSFRRCPYAMRARMAIAISGVDVEHREIVLRDKPSEMIAVSPKGTVPVVVLNNGQVLEESLDIMRWALGQNDPEGWLDRIDTDLIASNDGSFKYALDRYKYPHRYALVDGQNHRDNALPYLFALNDQIAGRACLVGTERGFTDIAMFPFVRQFAATDPIWFNELPIPALHTWLHAHAASVIFEQIMTKHPIWQAG